MSYARAKVRRIESGKSLPHKASEKEGNVMERA